MHRNLCRLRLRARPNRGAYHALRRGGRNEIGEWKGEGEKEKVEMGEEEREERIAPWLLRTDAHGQSRRDKMFLNPSV